jgi:hypothetical protein
MSPFFLRLSEYSYKEKTHSCKRQTGRRQPTDGAVRPVYVLGGLAGVSPGEVEEGAGDALIKTAAHVLVQAAHTRRSYSTYRLYTPEVHAVHSGNKVKPAEMWVGKA